MTIVKSDIFSDRLSQIIFFIAKDSKQNAQNFKNELQKSISSLVFMPYKYRKSIYFDNDNIRDCIFKGYCIPYFIDKEQNQI